MKGGCSGGNQKLELENAIRKGNQLEEEGQASVRQRAYRRKPIGKKVL